MGCFFFSFPFLHCPHFLSSFSPSPFYLNKSFPSLNPVRIENCRYHVGCFSGCVAVSVTCVNPKRWASKKLTGKWGIVGFDKENGVFGFLCKRGAINGCISEHHDSFEWLLPVNRVDFKYFLLMYGAFCVVYKRIYKDYWVFKYSSESQHHFLPLNLSLSRMLQYTVMTLHCFDSEQHAFPISISIKTKLSLYI